MILTIIAGIVMTTKVGTQVAPSIIDQIKGRNYRFIIYMDDLSFEEFEIEYKYLKAVIEGGLEKKPENVFDFNDIYWLQDIKDDINTLSVYWTYVTYYSFNKS